MFYVALKHESTEGATAQTSDGLCLSPKTHGALFLSSLLRPVGPI